MTCTYFLIRCVSTELTDRSMQVNTGHPESGNPGIGSSASLGRTGGISVIGGPSSLPPAHSSQESTSKSIFNSMKKRNRSINFLVNVPGTFSNHTSSSTTNPNNPNCNNNLQQKVKRIYL